MAKNRFAALLEEKGIPAGELSEAPVAPAEAAAPPAPEPPKAEPPATTQLPDPPAIRVSDAPPMRVAEINGQKPGKRSDPNYRQISTYVRGDLYKKVRKRLTDEERDFAELLDELLEKWIATEPLRDA